MLLDDNIFEIVKWISPNDIVNLFHCSKTIYANSKFTNIYWNAKQQSVDIRISKLVKLFRTGELETLYDNYWEKCTGNEPDDNIWEELYGCGQSEFVDLSIKIAAERMTHNELKKMAEKYEIEYRPDDPVGMLEETICQRDEEDIRDGLMDWEATFEQYLKIYIEEDYVKDWFKLLQIYERRKHDKESCPICLKRLTIPVKLQCGHIFDLDCILSWLKKMIVVR